MVWQEIARARPVELTTIRQVVETVLANEVKLAAARTSVVQV